MSTTFVIAQYSDKHESSLCGYYSRPFGIGARLDQATRHTTEEAARTVRDRCRKENPSLEFFYKEITA